MISLTFVLVFIIFRLFYVRFSIRVGNYFVFNGKVFKSIWTLINTIPHLGYCIEWSLDLVKHSNC